MLGYPAEVYVYGMQVLYKMLALPLMGLLFSYQLLPVFRDLGGISLYGVSGSRKTGWSQSLRKNKSLAACSLPPIDTPNYGQLPFSLASPYADFRLKLRNCSWVEIKRHLSHTMYLVCFRPFVCFSILLSHFAITYFSGNHF